MGAWEQWEPFSDPEYDAVWDRFYEQFNFRPSVAEWPGINEPIPSVTFSISHVYGEASRALALINDLDTEMLAAFRRCVSPEERLYALDWQHPCYWFYSHVPFDSSNPDAWPVPVLPNGDYYIFLAEDFSFGLFGHPWEQTICVFGMPLLEAVGKNRPILFDRPIRKDGQPIGDVASLR